MVLKLEVDSIDVDVELVSGNKVLPSDLTDSPVFESSKQQEAQEEKVVQGGAVQLSREEGASPLSRFFLTYLSPLISYGYKHDIELRYCFFRLVYSFFPTVFILITIKIDVDSFITLFFSTVILGPFLKSTDLSTITID
jgi:hypothetical protein